MVTEVDGCNVRLSMLDLLSETSLLLDFFTENEGEYAYCQVREVVVHP